MALGNLGALAIGHGGLGEALARFKQAYQAAPTAVGMALNLANAYRDRGRPADALAYYRQALDRVPDDVGVLVNAAEALGQLDGPAVTSNRDAVRAVTAACLASGVVESNVVNIPSQTLLVGDFSRWLVPGAPSLEEAALSELMAASDGLLTCHLVDSLITDPDLETLLTQARRVLPCRHAEGRMPASDLELARGLAYQGVLNEYLWAVGEDEERLLDALAAKLTAAAGAGAVDPIGLYLLAAYRSLATFEPLRRWAVDGRDGGGAMAGDLDFLILDQVREKSIAAGIRDLTPVDDIVSVRVQAQYEANPYPRWNSLARFEPIDPVAQVLNEVAPNRPGLKPLAERPAVLIAGCGTGRQPIQAAMTYRGASVLAIDLSMPSLAYAKRKAGDLGVDNISFARADILGLTGLPDRFQLIECSGVLHHMAEPEAGLRALLSLLAPGGLLKIALYSAAARENVTRLWQWIAERGFESSLEGIRAFRAALSASGHPYAAATCRSIDYNATSAIRDLLFHVQEHQFTVPRLKRMLEVNGLEFLGFLFRDAQVKASYLARFPGDPACVELDNWALFEAELPLTFVSMYQFWCRVAE